MKPFLSLVFSLVLVTFASSAGAQEATDKPAEAKIEKHKVGHSQITVPGAAINVWLRAKSDYGDRPPASLVQGANNGSLKWIPDRDPKIKEISYEVDVPETYQQGKPHGVMVFISASPKGKSPFVKLIGDNNLILIAANNSGNKTDTIWRHSYAVQAVELIAQRYDIDPDRIYVSGASGGGRVASQVMMMNSDLFTGGAPYVGANPCIPMKNASSDGTVYQDPGSWPKPDRRLLTQAAKFGRYAFMTGEKDYNRKNVQMVSQGYQKAGFANVLYLEQPGMKHGSPSQEYLQKAIDFLDAPLIQAAEGNYKMGQKKDLSGKLGEAMLLFQKASMHGRDADWISDAAEKAETLGGQYQAAVEATEAAIEANDKKAFKEALNVLGKQWSADSVLLKDYKKLFAAAAKAAKG